MGTAADLIALPISILVSSTNDAKGAYYHCSQVSLLRRAPGFGRQRRRPDLRSLSLSSVVYTGARVIAQLSCPLASPSVPQLIQCLE